MIKAPGDSEESEKGEDAENRELGQVSSSEDDKRGWLERVGRRSGSETSPSEFEVGIEPRRSREAGSAHHSL